MIVFTHSYFIVLDYLFEPLFVFGKNLMGIQVIALRGL